jgi:hypothetical protein
MQKSFLRLFILSFVMMLTLQFVYSQPGDKPDTTKVNLLGPKLAQFLDLNKDQVAKITPLVDSIKDIQKAQRKKMEEMRAKREAGEQMDRDEMMKMREQREKDVEVIKGLIESIKKELTKEQLEKFKEVQLPNLEMRRPGGNRPRN